MKKMNFLVMLAGTFFTVTAVMAQQDSSGIFKTADDFQEHKLTYAINYKTENHKINDDLIFNDADIKVTHQGQTYMLNKDNTYGYRSMKGEDFRFVSRKEYKILNPGETLLIYGYRHNENGTKGTVKYIMDYYFSTDASAIPQPLTKENLKAAFPANHKFHDGLDENFKGDDELIAYDHFHKMYKINHILLMSGK